MKIQASLSTIPDKGIVLISKLEIKWFKSTSLVLSCQQVYPMIIYNIFVYDNNISERVLSKFQIVKLESSQSFLHLRFKKRLSKTL